jgi:hypothetical protein
VLAFSVAALAAAAADARDPGRLLAARESEGPSVSAPPPAVLRLVWLDPAGVGAGLDRVARAEAESVLRRMGLAVSWRRGEAGDIARADEVRVILLDRLAARGAGVPVLGATPSAFAEAPFAWVHVPSVSAALGLPLRGRGPGMSLLEARTLAVAVGRVVAHEVVHAVAPAVGHGTGLMSATLTRRQLVAARMPFDPEVALAVRAALRGDTLSPRPDQGVLAAVGAGAGPPR